MVLTTSTPHEYETVLTHNIEAFALAASIHPLRAHIPTRDIQDATARHDHDATVHHTAPHRATTDISQTSLTGTRQEIHEQLPEQGPGD